MNLDIKNKKVLLMGLGILGGGVATARFLFEKGAKLTVTDLKDEQFLRSSLNKLKDLDVRYVLGKHEEKDFTDTDILVINPDVSVDNKFVGIARKAGKQIENELTLFFKYAKYKNIIGITGTRGKTTTTNWIGYILKEAGVPSCVLGNDPEKPFLLEINKCTSETVVVMEVPSFQLEIFDESGLAPYVAVITNLYQDHLSRHGTMEAYALAKANIFKNQNENNFLIIDKNNDWTKFFLDQNPKSKVIFTSDVDLPDFDVDKFSLKYGDHNLHNFLAAAAACLALGVKKEEVLESVVSLPQIKWREELVYEKGNLKIYNDTTATSPEASVSAVQRFNKAQEKFILITGGTDRELDFKDWGEFMNKNIKPENIILLGGSATEKMKRELDFVSEEFETLEECLISAIKRAQGAATIIFSPGSKSFEKFKNEFDRGEQFNTIIRKLLV